MPSFVANGGIIFYIMESIDIQKQIVNEIVLSLNEKFEEVFKEGLEAKGFKFETKEEFYNFIKENCRCEDFQFKNERVYYVNEIPFFTHYYQPIFEPFEINNNSISLKANNGSFKFV